MTKPAGTNGNGGRLRVAGRCLDCFTPMEVEELKGRVDRMVESDIQELRARIELVARSSDTHAARLDSVTSKLELITIGLDKFLADLGDKTIKLGSVIGRIGGRRSRGGESPK